MTVGSTGRGGEDNMCFLTIKESNRDYDGDWECEVFLSLIDNCLLFLLFVVWLICCIFAGFSAFFNATQIITLSSCTGSMS